MNCGRGLPLPSQCPLEASALTSLFMSRLSVLRLIRRRYLFFPYFCPVTYVRRPYMCPRKGTPLDIWVIRVFSRLSLSFNFVSRKSATSLRILWAVFLSPLIPMRKSSAYLQYVMLWYSLSQYIRLGIFCLYASDFLPVCVCRLYGR